MHDVVVIMAKAPVPGGVKTRLAAGIGAAAACELYRAFLRDLRRLGGGPWRLVWAVHPPGADLRADAGAAAECIDQRGEDLAARMENAVADAFAAGADRVALIGADVPHLGADAVAAAFGALARCDVVLKPTRDGGYCLVGLRAPADVFRGVAMGTAAVRRQTLARAAALGLAVELLPETFDVDQPADLDRLAALIARGELDLPETRRALRACGLSSPGSAAR